MSMGGAGCAEASGRNGIGKDLQGGKGLVDKEEKDGWEDLELYN